MNKSQFRIELQHKRALLTQVDRQKANQQICHHISTSKIWQQAQNIAIYLAFNSEADITALLNSEKTIYLPSIKNQTMQFQAVTPNTTFETLSYGLKQPVFDELQEDQNIDLYLMPLLGFDLCGNRLGMGGGYYDRYFAEHHSGIRAASIRAGVAYQCQQTEQLPSDPWDVKIQHVFTEQAHHEF